MDCQEIGRGRERKREGGIATSLGGREQSREFWPKGLKVPSMGLASFVERAGTSEMIRVRGVPPGPVYLFILAKEGHKYEVRRRTHIEGRRGGGVVIL